MIIDLSSKDLFNEIYLPLLSDSNRYLLLYGGRDSAKSYFAAQKVIIDTMKRQYSRYILVRKVYAHIKDSQFQTIKDIVQSYGLMDLFAFNENPLKITFKKNGNMILARGIRRESGALIMPAETTLDKYSIEKLIKFNKLNCVQNKAYVYK